MNKLSELELLIKDENIDVIGISETWLVEDISDSEISFNGYSIFRCDRKDLIKKRGGGVLIWVKNELNPSQVQDLCDLNFQESIWCSIKCTNKNITIGVVYRAPDSSKLNDEALYNLINKLYDKKVLIMGDFNFAELDWSNRANIDISHPFVDCISSIFLEQYCNEPTRGKNYLDLVLCSDELIQGLEVGEPFETSDHQMIRFLVKCSWVHSKTLKYDYFKANYDDIRMYAKRNNLFMSSCEGNTTSVGEMWNNIREGLNISRNNFIKLKAKNKERSKWSTKKVRSRRKAKKLAWNNYKSSDNKEVLYKVYQDKLKISVAENRRKGKNLREFN